MKSPGDKIALQGIEFWSTVCDEEADLAIEAAEVRAWKGPPPGPAPPPTLSPAPSHPGRRAGPATR